MTCFAFASTPFLSSLLDAIFPLENGDTRRIFPIHANYIFFDGENYFYAVSTHTAIVAHAVMCLYIAHDSFFLIAVQHTCGLLAVVRYFIHLYGFKMDSSKIFFKIFFKNSI